jgi:hypothetical protein
MTGFANPAPKNRGQELILLDHCLYRTQHCPRLIDDRHGDFQIPIAFFVKTQLSHP